MKTSRYGNPSRRHVRPLGILGGIFDPIHNGHCAVACLARDYFGLETVFLVPAGVPPHKHKPDITGSRHRLAMTRLAAAGSARLAVWDGEIRRKGFSYTVETVREIAARFQERPLYFIIGSDNLREIKTWNRYRKFLKAVTLCVAHRPGYSLRIPPELAKASIITFPSPEWGISSTLVRRFFALGYSCEYLVPRAVLAYVRRHNLYRAK